MSAGAAPKETLPLTPDQKQVVANLATVSQLVAGLLLLVGVTYLAGGLVSMIALGGGILTALLSMAAGAVIALLGLVMLAVSSDFKYLGQFSQYAGKHLRNAAKNLTKFYQVHIALAVVLVLLAPSRMT